MRVQGGVKKLRQFFVAVHLCKLLQVFSIALRNAVRTYTNMRNRMPGHDSFPLGLICLYMSNVSYDHFIAYFKKEFLFKIDL